MATKPVKQAETTERTEEQADSPILDSLTAPVRKMVARGKERGYVTYDELNKALPSDEVNSEQIEDTMTMLSEMGINVIESEESEESTNEEQPEAAAAPATTPATVDEDDLGRTDDPVRMYLREMGSVELLSREGEIAIAKRIEAGRQTMIGGICESPLTMRAIIKWRDELAEGQLLLRDIIDLEATYGGGPEGADRSRRVGEGCGGRRRGRRWHGRRRTARMARSRRTAPRRARARKTSTRGTSPSRRHGSCSSSQGHRDLRRDRSRLQEISRLQDIAPRARAEERDADRVANPALQPAQA